MMPTANPTTQHRCRGGARRRQSRGVDCRQHEERLDNCLLLSSPSHRLLVAGRCSWTRMARNSLSWWQVRRGGPGTGPARRRSWRPGWFNCSRRAAWAVVKTAARIARTIISQGSGHHAGAGPRPGNPGTQLAPFGHRSSRSKETDRGLRGGIARAFRASSITPSELHGGGTGRPDVLGLASPVTSPVAAVHPGQ